MPDDDNAVPDHRSDQPPCFAARCRTQFASVFCAPPFLSVAVTQFWRQPAGITTRFAALPSVTSRNLAQTRSRMSRGRDHADAFE